MRHVLILACSMTASALMAQCTVADLDFDSLSLHWADGYSDAQGHLWGAAFVTDGSRDILAMHLDADGEVVWTKRLATLNPFVGLYPTKAVPSASGGMLIIGNRTAPTHENWFGLQVDANGNLEWARIYMEPLGDYDGYLTLPTVDRLSSGGYQMTIPAYPGIQSLRLVEDGTPVWHRRYTADVGTDGYDLVGLSVGTDGGLSYAAYYIAPNGLDTIATVVFKTNADGIPIWGRKILGGEFSAQAIGSATNGDVLIAGNTSESTEDFTNSSVLRIGSEGDLLWAERFDSHRSIRAVQELTNGDILLSPDLNTILLPDTSTMLRIAADGTPLATYTDGSPTNLSGFQPSYYFLPTRSEAIAGADGSLTVMHTTEANGTMGVRRVHEPSGGDPTCGMEVAPLVADALIGLTSEPVTITMEDDTVRTWTMALVGYDQTATELAAYLYGGIPPRPGFNHTLHGGIWNVGGITSGAAVVTLTYEAPATYVSAFPVPASVTSNTVTWESSTGFTGFEPNYYSATFNLPPDTALLGDQLVSTLTVTQDSVEFTLDNNTATLTQTVVGSYDPNDKLVFPKDAYHIENDSTLDYTIRFQNTGTFMAETVVVRDTLPLDLDVMTFRIGAASHPFTYSLTGNGILEVRFDNINLPDSNANEPLSHGMVGFRIDPILPLSLGQEITNTADIYFDFNPPIHTPDATVIVTDETGIHPAVKLEKLSVFPVPVRTTLTAQLPAGFEPANAFAIGTDGRRIPLFRPNVVEKRAEYGVQHLPPGAYVLTLIDRSGKRVSARFTKE